jgi:hypothetical protein
MTITNNPAIPGAFTAGPSAICPGATGVIFTIPAVTGATGYSWTTPVGTSITGGQNTPGIIVNFPNPYSDAPPVCVSATSACGSSLARCKTVGSNLPHQPGAISGPTTNICNSTVQYSIANVPGATGYTWTNPAGTTINSGQGSTTILLNVSPSFTNGQLTVTANTTMCIPGISSARTITITGKPNIPGTITAFPGSWCNGDFVNFSVATISPVPVYNWTVSNGTITGGQGSNNIDVSWGTGTGSVNVNAGNGCGGSGTRSQSFIGISCREVENQLIINTTQLTTYPSPAHTKVTVNMSVKESSTFSLQLNDLTGRILIFENQIAKQGINTYDLDLTHISKGIYMLIATPLISEKGFKRMETKIVVE